MRSTPQKLLAGGATATLALTFLSATSAASAEELRATQMSSISSVAVVYANGKTANANLTKLDRNGDGKADNFAYCIEPGVDTPADYKSGKTPFAGNKVPWSKYADAGKLRWVLTHGAKAQSLTKLNAAAGAKTAGIAFKDQERAAISATQSAIWGHAFNWRVSPTFAFKRGDAKLSAYFHTVYQYLMTEASSTSTGNHEWILWAESGVKEVQDLIQIPRKKTVTKPKPNPGTDPKPDPGNSRSGKIVIDGKVLTKVTIAGKALSTTQMSQLVAKFTEQGINIAKPDAATQAMLKKAKIEFTWTKKVDRPKPEQKKPEKDHTTPNPGSEGSADEKKPDHGVVVGGKVITKIVVNGRVLSDAEAKKMIAMLKKQGIDLTKNHAQLIKMLKKQGVTIEWAGGGTVDDEDVTGGGNFFENLFGLKGSGGGGFFGKVFTWPMQLFGGMKSFCGGLFG